MKKCLIFILFLTSLLLLFPGCRRADPLDALSEQLSVDLTGAEQLYEEDSHGGFHGDGESLTVLQLSASAATELASAESLLAGWQPLPLPKSLSQAVYGDGNHQALLDGFPESEDGFYWFYDRHSGSTDPQDPSDLWKRPSFNFSLALYDSESQQLYYAEFDT